MMLEHAQAIVDNAEDELSLRDDYGRGMNNKRTAGVTGSMSRIIGGIAAAAAALATEDSENAEAGVPTNKADEFVRAMHRLSWDSMGLDTIVY